MTRIIVSRQADSDIDGIFDILCERAGLAERYAADLRATYERLEMFPRIGALRREFRRDIRIVVLHPYVLIYRHEPDRDTVTAMRVLDGRRNITRRLIWS
jgi:toxin ParE1/3/4